MKKLPIGYGKLQINRAITLATAGTGQKGLIVPMLEFKEITISDREWIQPLLDMSSFRSMEYSFNFTYLWREVLGYQVARMNDYYLLKSARPGHPVSYLYPAGSGDVFPVLEALREDAARCGSPLLLHGILGEQKALLEILFPDKFEFIELSDYSDYIYESEKLISLSGKKLHAKRNFVNRFKKENPDWAYEKINHENMMGIREMTCKWLGTHEHNKTLDEESRSVLSAIDHFFELKLDGGLIRAGGQVVAFSMGDRLTHDTYLVHIEKAFSDVPGAYAIINQQFAEKNCSGYTYINREDDSGQEGLRKAKLSYRPAFMMKKYGAKEIG